MRTFISGILSLAIVFTPYNGFAAASSKQGILAESLREYASAKTFSGLLAKLQSVTQPELYELLKSKIPAEERNSSLPRLEAKAGNSYALSYKTMVIAIEFLAPGERRIKVNGHELVFGADASAETIWNKVVAALPQKTAAHPVSGLLLPRARAVVPVAVVALIAAVAVSTIGMMVMTFHESACTTVTNQRERCHTEKSRLIGKISENAQAGRNTSDELDLKDAKMTLADAEKTRDAWATKLAMCGEDTTKLKNCIDDIIHYGKQALGYDLSEHARKTGVPAGPNSR